MKPILFILDIPLNDAMRGTPIRIYHILRQIAQTGQLIVCAQDVPADLAPYFISYPKGSAWERLRFFRRLIRERGIACVMTATETGMRIPIYLKWLTGVKIVMDLHGLSADEQFYFGKISRWKRWVLEREARFFLSFFDRVFPVSKKLLDYYGGWDGAGEVLYGGVDLAQFPAREEEEPKEFTIGYMGNARPYQGLKELFDAARLLRDQGLAFRLNLVVSGDGERVAKMLEEDGLTDRATMHVDVPHDRVHAIISRSTVLVIPRPSIAMTEYAYPSKTPEYLATAVPVIMTDVGPVRELFAPAECCVVVPTDRMAEGLAAALGRVASWSSEERRIFGQRARAFVASRLTWDVLGAGVRASLERL